MAKELFTIRITLFGLAMWFFGNLYEGIVLAPNQLVDTIEKLEIWDQYFTVTNPIFYFVPITHLAVILIWILAFNRKLSYDVAKDIKKSAVILFLAEVVTVYIVTQLNLSLFFGEEFSQKSIFKVRLWNVLNLLRVILVGRALWFAFKAYTKQIETNATIEVKTATNNT